MARVPVFEPLGGAMVYIDEGDLAAATQQGFTQPTPQEVAQAELKAEYGGTLNQLGAGATGVASGLTLGLSDIALAELGGRERLAAYESLFPTERAAGTVAGAVLPALLSAGTSAPASGASLAARALAATPAALATRAGTGIAAGLGLAAAEGVASGVGRTALRLGVSSGIESAIQGAGFEAGKLALDDKLTGESIGQIASAGLTQGAVGFGLGSGLGLLAGGSSSLLARRRAALGAEGVDAPPGFFAKMQVKMQKLGAYVRGANPADAEEYVARQAAREVGVDAVDDQAVWLSQPAPLRTAASSVEPLGVVVPATPAAAEVARVADAATDAEQMIARMKKVDDADAAIQEIERLDAKVGDLGRKIRDELDDFLPAEELTDTATRSMALKTELLIAGNVAQETLPLQRAFVENTLLEFDNAIKEIADDADRFYPGPLKQLKVVQNRVQKLYEAALLLPEKEQPAAFYRLVDRDLKSAVGTITAPLMRKGGTPNIRETAARLGAFYKIPQLGLESVELFGPIGNVQKQLNPEITNALNLKGTFRDDWFESAPSRKNPVDPWGRGLPVSDPKKILRIVEESVTQIGSTAEARLNRYLSYKRNYYQVLLKHGDFTGQPKLLGAIESQAKRLERIVEQFEIGKSNQRNINFASPVGTGLSRTVDALPGVGGAKAIANVIFSPRLIASAARTVESLAGSQSKTVASSASKAVRAIEAKAVPVAARATATGATGPRYDALSRRTSELATQRPAVLAQLEKETAWIGDAAPVAHQEAISAAARKLDYLARMLPRGLAAATPFSAPLPPTKQQQQEWLSRVKALDNPAGMLTDFTAGKLTPQAVEAVREVYPETLASIQTQVMERLSVLQSRGKAPSYLERLQLGLLLGIPTDPTLAPNVARAIQAQYAAQPGAAQGGAAPAPGRSRKPPQIAGGFRSGSQELEVRSDQP
jgi:hypothetical protein